MSEMSIEDLGALVDQFLEVREMRYEAQKVVDELRAVETRYKDQLIENIGEDNAVGGKTHVASLTRKSVPVIKDSGTFLAWVQQEGRLDMLQKRLSTTAVKDFQEEQGMLPPGLDTLFVNDISVRKR